MKDYVEIYTDGSSSNNKTLCGGWSAILLFKDKEKRIYSGEPPEETNQTMEMTGVIKALEELRTTKIPVRIYSDSAYIVNCFKEKWYVNWKKNGWVNSQKKPVANRGLWERMIELYEKQQDIEFVKVKGHANNHYNEIADKLAVKGRHDIEQQLGLR
jgi:ribonuclease HI